MTRLVGVVKGPALADIKRQIQSASSYADLLEIRLDTLYNETLGELKELPRSLPLIFTWRRKKDGGESELPEEERIALLEKALEMAPAYVDLEVDLPLEVFDRIKKNHPLIQVIGSFHDLSGAYQDPEEIFDRIHKPQISLYKMVFSVQSAQEILRILKFNEMRPAVSCFSAGVDASISRILAPVVGSELCYACIESQDSSLGQITLQELCEVYRFRELSGEEHIFALLGDPVEQSIGHIYHNRSLPKGALYLKLRVAIPELAQFFTRVRDFPFRGLSITMPLKEQLKPFLTRLDEDALAIGSVNTVVITPQELIGYNTDGVGALNALEKRALVRGAKIAILGAGGSARAIAYEAKRRGADVTLFNRTPERAEKVAQELGCRATSWDNLSLFKGDFLINTVPGNLLFTQETLPSVKGVMDIVYYPQEVSYILQAAESKGFDKINPSEMFEEQAKLQQKLWLFSK